MPEQYSVFVAQGGLGKQIASTAVAEAIKNNYPTRQLIVVTSYPEVYINNPIIYKVFRIGGAPYFYKDYIEGKDTLVFNGDPYYCADHIHKRKHLIINWCNLFNLKYNNEMPKIYFNKLELDFAIRKYGSPKPICVLQTNGGVYNSEKPYCWTRDLPPTQTQDIVNVLKKDYIIYHISRPKSYKLEDVTYISDVSKRELISILTVSQKRILIDSCLQHAAAALNLPSTVCWVGTSSTSFGYSIHKNVTPIADKDMNHLSDSFLFDFDFNGHEVEYPYSTNLLFEINQIVS